MATRFDNLDGRLRGEKGKQRRLRLWSKSPNCAMCGILTEYPRGFEVDHIRPLSQGGSDTDDNLQILCSGVAGCHAKKTIREDHNDPTVTLFPDWLEPAACHLTIVFGPPGSGKSAYVAEHAGRHDLVIDLDEIVAELSGMPIYQAPAIWFRRGVHLRNRMLSSLAKQSRGAAWFIAMGQGKADRKWWAEKLKPSKTLTLNVPESECIARVNEDSRRPEEVKAQHIAAIKRWWQAEAGMASGNSPAAGVGIDGWPL